MKIPAIPLNEEARLLALESYQILDSIEEKEYDDITKIASLICDTPISMISLVDRKRQYFKAKRGVDDSETPREVAFCAHAINEPDKIMIVQDSSKDERFADNPFVTGNPHIVFYAGTPLVTPEGFALGTLCVIDRKPKTLTAAQKEALKSLGNQVVQLLELRRKNKLLKKMQKELELRADEMESFAYTASHDLKEPVRMVKSFSEILMKKYQGSLDEKAKIFLFQIMDGADRMNNLITDLLNYSLAGQSERDDTDEFALEEIITEIKQLFKLTIAEKNAVITAENLPVLRGSKTAIRQVLQNLTGNALKYQPASNKPVISINVTENNSHWKFSVADNGIGIPAGSLSAIFTIFKRLHTRQAYQGTGIGLAVCKKIVNSLGGEIWVESEPEKGSVFYFTIQRLSPENNVKPLSAPYGEQLEAMV